MSRMTAFTGLTLIAAIVAQSGAQTPPPGNAAPPASAPAPQKRILPIPPVYQPPPPMAPQAIKGEWFEVSEAVYSWGDVWEGEPVTHGFQIKNTTSDKEIEIRDAKADCHCTVPGNFDRRIAPGQTGVVPF